MAEITVTSAEIRRRAGELKRLNESFKRKAGALEQTELLLNSMWDGQAQTAFHRTFLNDKRKMDTFYRAINSYITALGDIASKYESAERKNLMILSGGGK